MENLEQDKPLGWVPGDMIIQLMEDISQEDIDKRQVRPKLDKEGNVICIDLKEEENGKV
jgi:hypothetical protein